MRTPTDLPCPCGHPAAYAACCGRWHGHPDNAPANATANATANGLANTPANGPEPAPDAPTLMRSRYSAYVLGLDAYLLATWHPRTRPAALDPQPAGLRWLGLEVKGHRLIDADHAEVRFVARSKLAGRAHRLQETSRFERVDGRWLYVDGDVT